MDRHYYSEPPRSMLSSQSFTSSARALLVALTIVMGVLVLLGVHT